MERYLEKESTILSEVISKQAMRQKAEYSRLHDQVLDCRKIRDELDKSKMEAVNRLKRVETVLGTECEAALLESFSKPIDLVKLRHL